MLMRMHWWALLWALFAPPHPAQADFETLATTYRFVKPLNRAPGGSLGGTHDGTDTTDAKAWSLYYANNHCAAGRTFVLLPGDYSTEGGGNDIDNAIDPQSAGTGLSPDSSVRYVSWDFYNSRDVSNPQNFYLDGTELNKAYVMVTGLSFRREASHNRQSGLVGAQWDSISYCYLRGYATYGVNTAIAYRDTIYHKEVGAYLPNSIDNYLIALLGENSSCGGTQSCALISSDVVIRRCVVIVDSLRQGGKVFFCGGRQTRCIVDSSRVTATLVSEPAGNNIGNLAAAIWAELSGGVTFRDNKWTLEMLNGAGCTVCPTTPAKSTTGFAFFYVRDSTQYFFMQRDTASLAMNSTAGCGMQAHWVASGNGKGDGNHNGWENCVIRGKFISGGMDFQSAFDHYSLIGNSIFSEAGGPCWNFNGGNWKSGNIFKRNTLVSRDAPAIVMASTADANPPERNKIEENCFVRMHTTRKFGTNENAGTVAFMQTPTTASAGSFSINSNLYYSYTGAVSQAVGWASSSGSCVGQSPGCFDSCASVNPRCWPPSPLPFDALSKWGDPLFRDTTAANFSGDILCYDATTGARSALYGLGSSPDSAIGARQPQGASVDPREPYEYATDSLGRQLVIDTLSTTSGVMTFKFKAPPDDAVNLVGTASAYECAYSEMPITAANFGTCSLAAPPTPAAPGSIVSFTVPGVKNHVYYVAVRTIGSCGRISPAISDNGCAVVRGSLTLCP